MIKKILANKLYIVFSSLICALMCALSLAKQSYQCAVLLSAIVTLSSYMYIKYGIQKTMISSASAVILGSFLLWNVIYYISGISFQHLTTISLLSSFSAIASGLLAFARLNIKYSFALKNLYANLVAAIVDIIIMAGFFLRALEPHLVLSFSIKELVYKLLFALFTYVTIAVVSYFVKDIRVSNAEN